MRQNALESLVSGIKQLNAVLVVMVPDCLLFTAWQRSGQVWDAETAGAYLGELIHSTEQGAQAIDGWSGGPASITLESEAGLIVIREVKEPFVIAYLFEKGTAIGWARLQIQRTLGSIEQTLEEVESSGAAAVGPAPTRTEVKAAPPPRPSRPAPAPAPRPAPPAARPAPAPAPRPAPPAAKPAAPAPPVARPAAPAAAPAAAVDTSVKPKPNTASVTRVTPPSTAPTKNTDNKPAAGASSQPASATLGHDPTPKGTRLIKYLDAHAPDTHAALLRVSLQTGLPLTLLRMPDSLSDDEFAQVEESVRRILGVDQLNF